MSTERSHLRAVHVLRQVSDLQDGQDIVARDVVGNNALGNFLELEGFEALGEGSNVTGKKRGNVLERED